MMEMFLYLDRDTYVHRLDPRTKIFIMLASFAFVMLAGSISLLAGIGLVIIAYGASGQTLSNLHRIKYVLIMVPLVSMLLWSWLGQGATVLWGPFTREGLWYGIGTGIQLDVMMMAGMIFLSSTKIEEISLGLVKLGLPYRVAFAFSTAIRLVPMIVGTSYIIIQAQRSRGLDIDSGNVMARTKKYIPLLIPVIVSVLRGTNVFAMALESKGFGYSDVRSNYLKIGYQKVDILLLGMVALLMGILGYMKYIATIV